MSTELKEEQVVIDYEAYQEDDGYILCGGTSEIKHLTIEQLKKGLETIQTVFTKMHDSVDDLPQKLKPNEIEAEFSFKISTEKKFILSATKEGSFTVKAKWILNKEKDEEKEL